jgi:predicted nucleic-acid-binding Zn-ribbon protein
MENKTWNCLKCGYDEYETDQFAATDGGLSKLFDVQNKKFITVTCNRCRFTEIYKSETGTAENIFDFLTG